MTRALAIGTKLRAMHGKRLTDHDYDALTQCRTVSEVAAYLKSETHFSISLSNMQAEAIHRGQLELLLGRELFDEVSRLRRYDRNGVIFKLYYGRIELMQIISCIGFLREERQAEFVASIPGYLLGKLRLDLDALVRVTDTASLIRAASRTQYAKPLQKLADEFGGTLPAVSICSARLGTCFYQNLLRDIAENFSGTACVQLRELILTQVELVNITVAYRQKKYFGADAARIEQRIIPIYHRVRKRMLEQLLNATDASAFEVLLVSLGHVHLSDFSFIEHSVDVYHLRKCAIRFNFSTDHAVMFAAFTVLREIELSNVLAIIEGVRYSVRPEEIQQLLVRLELKGG